MAKCASCGRTILFGGERFGGLRFCNKKCLDSANLLQYVSQIDEKEFQDYVTAMHGTNCPLCGRPGPVDVHSFHTVWSAIYLTSWKSTPRVSCRSCGIKGQLKGILQSAILGWWGIPFGLIITAVQIIRNIGGLISPPSSSGPSKKLEEMLRARMILELAAQNHGDPVDSPPSGGEYKQG